MLEILVIIAIGLPFALLCLLVMMALGALALAAVTVPVVALVQWWQERERGPKRGGSR